MPTTLSRDIAALERAAARGLLTGRDLQVIATQIARAEAKILKVVQASALSTATRRVFLPDSA